MLSKLINEFKRMLPMIIVIISAVCIFGDTAQLAVQIYKLSMVSLVLIMTHIIRKTLFPYLDLGAIIDGCDSATSKSIVALGTLLFMAAILIISVV